MKNAPKKVVAMGDLHCGHIIGLTHPAYQQSSTSQDPRVSNQAKLQSAMWDFYAQTLKDIGPVDLLIVNGDTIDGSGVKSGGTELLSTDRMIQVDMAEAAIRECDAKRIQMTYGTGYHTGNFEDFEDILAERLDADIQAQVFMDVNGCIIDAKHHIGSSGLLHGRHTAVAKDHMWNILLAEREDQPLSNLTLRSHVHYYSYSGGIDWTGIILPALQGPGSKYGARRCTGSVDFGLLEIDVDSNGSYSWTPHIKRIGGFSHKPVKV